MRFARCCAAVLAVAACGRYGGGAASIQPSPTQNAIAVALTPASTALASGQRLQFNAAVSGRDPRVAWSVLEGDAGGIVDATGLYVAPLATGTFHVIAASMADPSRSASAEIAVLPSSVRVRISPLAVTLSPGASLQFSATVAGASDPGVDWYSDCCALASDGTFTARDEGSFTVVARSRADGAQSAAARVTVQTGADIDPVAVTLEPGGQISFHSRLAGSWSVLEGAGGGSITSDGAYRAPAGRGGIFHVVATSEGRTSTALVTILPPDLIDHGGPVVPSTRTFALFWGDPAGFPADLRPLQESLLGSLAGSEYLALANQYLRGAKASTRFAATLIDPSLPPDSPDKAGARVIGGEACDALRSAGIAPAAGDMVFVYSSASLSPSPGWCAWHSTFECGGTTLMVSFVPPPGGSGCLRLGADIGCNGATPEANATASLTAHELLEAITDPLVTAWTDAAGQELGDKCEDELRCIQLPGGAFQLQAEYSNAAHACAP